MTIDITLPAATEDDKNTDEASDHTTTTMDHVDLFVGNTSWGPAAHILVLICVAKVPSSAAAPNSPGHYLPTFYVSTHVLPYASDGRGRANDRTTLVAKSQRSAIRPTFQRTWQKLAQGQTMRRVVVLGTSTSHR